MSINNENQEELGKAIRHYIEKAGFKQIHVCNETGLSPSRLSNYLNGYREPDWETLCMLVDFLGIKLDDLRHVKNVEELVLEEFNAGNAKCNLIIKTAHGSIQKSIDPSAASSCLNI